MTAQTEKANALGLNEFRLFPTVKIDSWQTGLTAEKRKIAFRRKRGSVLQREWDSDGVTEQGGELLYEMTDTGFVMCSMYGYKTEWSEPAEGMILINSRCDPRDLARTGIPDAHWRSFQSYLRVTCVDDLASMRDRLHVRWLRWSRPLMGPDRKVIRPKFSLFGLKFSTWLPLTVAAATVTAISELTVNWLVK